MTSTVFDNSRQHVRVIKAARLVFRPSFDKSKLSGRRSINPSFQVVVRETRTTCCINRRRSINQGNTPAFSRRPRKAANILLKPKHRSCPSFKKPSHQVRDIKAIWLVFQVFVRKIKATGTALRSSFEISRHHVLETKATRLGFRSSF